MSQGLQVWDASGAIVLDTGDRLGLIVGTVQTGTSDGSVSDSRLFNGAAFWFCAAINASAQSNPVAPFISFSGTTISWTFPSTGTKVNCYLSFGVY